MMGPNAPGILWGFHSHAPGLDLCVQQKTLVYQGCRAKLGHMEKPLKVIGAVTAKAFGTAISRSPNVPFVATGMGDRNLLINFTSVK